MTEKMRQSATWLAARMKEPSTWAGVAAMSALAHHQLDSEMAQNLATAGTVLGGVLASTLSESSK